MKFEVPTANNYPFDIIPILFAKTSASSKWCVVKINVLFSYLIFNNIFHIALLEYASIPDVGSSKNMIFESPIKDIAKLNLRYDPLDNVYINLFYSFTKSVLCSIPSISEISEFLISA